VTFFPLARSSLFCCYKITVGCSIPELIKRAEIRNLCV
jgi:hypothetical protein